MFSLNFSNESVDAWGRLMQSMHPLVPAFNLTFDQLERAPDAVTAISYDDESLFADVVSGDGKLYGFVIFRPPSVEIVRIEFLGVVRGQEA